MDVSVCLECNVSSYPDDAHSCNVSESALLVCGDQRIAIGDVYWGRSEIVRWRILFDV